MYHLDGCRNLAELSGGRVTPALGGAGERAAAEAVFKDLAALAAEVVLDNLLDLLLVEVARLEIPLPKAETGGLADFRLKASEPCFGDELAPLLALHEPRFGRRIPGRQDGLAALQAHGRLIRMGDGLRVELFAKRQQMMPDAVA